MDKDKYLDNWRFSSDNMPLNEETLNGYIDKYGEDRALGYLEAIADVRAECSWMLANWNPMIGGQLRSASKTQTMLKEFEVHKKIFIEKILSHPVVSSDDALLLKLKQK